MCEKKTSVLFKIIKWCVKIFYPKTKAEGTEYLPGEPVIDSADALYRLLSDDGLREIAGDIVRM